MGAVGRARISRDLGKASRNIAAASCAGAQGVMLREAQHLRNEAAAEQRINGAP
jgi:hypothetical protein